VNETGVEFLCLLRETVELETRRGLKNIINYEVVQKLAFYYESAMP